MGRNWKFLFLYGLGLPPRLARAAAITNCFTSCQLRFLTLLCWIFIISFSHLLTPSNLCNNEYYHLGRQKALLKFYGENIILCLQMVLAHVTNKLSSHVTYLTVQVFKDDWIRSSSGSKLNIPSLQSTPHNMPYYFKPRHQDYLQQSPAVQSNTGCTRRCKLSHNYVISSK